MGRTGCLAINRWESLSFVFYFGIHTGDSFFLSGLPPHDSVFLTGCPLNIFLLSRAVGFYPFPAAHFFISHTFYLFTPNKRLFYRKVHFTRNEVVASSNLACGFPIKQARNPIKPRFFAFFISKNSLQFSQHFVCFMLFSSHTFLTNLTDFSQIQLVISFL